MVAFVTLAQQCAASGVLDLLVGLAAVSSGFDATAISAGGARHAFGDAGRAIAGAVGAMDQGQDVAVGLMGISAQRLSEMGIGLAEALEPCRSLVAAETMAKSIEADAKKRGVSGTRAVEIGFFVPGGRFKTAEEFADAVEAARKDANALMKAEIKGIVGRLVPQRAVHPTKEVPENLSLPADVRGQERTAESWDAFGDYATVAGKPNTGSWDVFGDYAPRGSAPETNKNSQGE